MSAITDEAVAAKARELHDEGCPAPCAFGITSTWLHYARAVLEHEARQAEADRDRDRVVAELRERIDHGREVGVDFEAIVRSLSLVVPDVVRAAIDVAGAPT
jgi:hypothetical protein